MSTRVAWPDGQQLAICACTRFRRHRVKCFNGTGAHFADRGALLSLTRRMEVDLPPPRTSIAGTVARHDEFPGSFEFRGLESPSPFSGLARGPTLFRVENV